MDIQRHSEVDGVAIAALVVGIVSLVFFLPFFVLGPVAMYLGHSADRRIRLSGGALTGVGLALAGRILGAVSFTVGLLALAVVLALGVAIIPGTSRAHVQVQPAQTLQHVSVQSQASGQSAP